MATIEGTNAPDASSTLTELEDTELVEDSVSSVLSYCALYISFPSFISVTYSYYTLLCCYREWPIFIDHLCSSELYCTLFLWNPTLSIVFVFSVVVWIFIISSSYIFENKISFLETP